MMKRSQLLILFICTLLFGWFLFNHWSLLPKLAVALSKGHHGWLAAAFAGQIVGIGMLTTLYQSAFRAAGVRQTFSQLLPQSLAAMFIDTTAPAGGIASTAVFVNNAHHQKQSGARTAAGVLLWFIANNGVALALLLVSLVILAAKGLLSSKIVVVSLIFGASVIGMVGLLWLGVRRVGVLHRLLDGVRRLANRTAQLFGRNPILTPDWAARQSADFNATAQTITHQPRRLVRVTAVSFLMHLSLITVMAAIFLAFNQPLNWAVILTGYVMNVLFTNVSPTPNGVGVVELAVPTVLKSLGMASPAAVGVTLAFRLFSFWLPLALGFVAMRNLRAHSQDRAIPA